MSSLSMFLLSFTVGLSGAMSPGPLTVLTVSETARRGMQAPFLIILGHALLELAATTLLALGLLALVNPGAIGGIALVGGSVMALMGLAMARDALRSPPFGARRPVAAVGRRSRLVGASIVASLSNPYWTVWWVTVAAGLLVSAAKSGLPTIVAFYTGHILADTTYYVALGMAVTAGRRFIGGRAYRILMATLALALAGFGVYFAMKGYSSFK